MEFFLQMPKQVKSDEMSFADSLRLAADIVEKLPGYLTDAKNAGELWLPVLFIEQPIDAESPLKTNPAARAIWDFCALNNFRATSGLHYPDLTESDRGKRQIWRLHVWLIEATVNAS